MTIYYQSMAAERICIKNFIEENQGLKKSDCVAILKRMGYKKSNIYNIYKSHENNIDIQTNRKMNINIIKKKRKITSSIKKKHYW